MRWLFVIARNTSFAYKGNAIDVKQIGRELGVRYVLEAACVAAVRRVRVNAQLIDAETGNHVWAERYDRDLVDVFAVQDEITLAVTRAIEPAVDDAEQRRALRKLPRTLGHGNAYQRGCGISRESEGNSRAVCSSTVRSNSTQRSPPPIRGLAMLFNS